MDRMLDLPAMREWLQASQQEVETGLV
jgi:hypothetical protein